MVKNSNFARKIFEAKGKKCHFRDFCKITHPSYHNMTARDAREKNFHSTRLYNPQEGISDEKLKFLEIWELYIGTRESKTNKKNISFLLISLSISQVCASRVCWLGLDGKMDENGK